MREASHALALGRAPLPENDVGLPEEVNCVEPQPNEEVRILDGETEFDIIRVDPDEVKLFALCVDPLPISCIFNLFGMQHQELALDL